MTNVKTLGATLLAIGGAAYVLHPEVPQLLAGEPLGNDVGDVIVGGSILALVAGLEVIGRLERTGRIDRRAMFWAFGLLVGAIALVDGWVFFAVPDSPGAMGVVLVCLAGIATLLYAAREGRIEEPAYDTSSP